MAQGMKAIIGREVELGERGLCVILDIMKISMQIAIWEGSMVSLFKHTEGRPAFGRRC